MTQNLNVNRLKSQAWDQKAVQQKGHINIVIPQKMIEESRKNGGATTREPMKDLTHSICEAVFEEFEPVVRGMPVWENVITYPGFSSTVMTFVSPGVGPCVPTPIPGVPNIIFHSLKRIPKGYIVVSKSGPVIITDGPGWTPTTITLLGMTVDPTAAVSVVKILVF